MASAADAADIFAGSSDEGDVVVRPSAARAAAAIASAAANRAETADDGSDSEPETARRAPTQKPVAAQKAAARAGDDDSESDDDSSSGGSSSDSSSDSSDKDSSASDSDSSASSGNKPATRQNVGAPPRKKLPKRQEKAQRPVRERRAPQDKSLTGARDGSGKDDGDSYASEPEEGPTAEDDAFIDREDDDVELLAEYDKDTQNFREERPGKKRRRDPEEEEEVDAGDVPEDAKKSSKKKKGLSDAEKAKLVSDLLRDMQAAARFDRKDRGEGKPALHKLKLLDRMRRTLAITELHQMLIEGVARGSDADYDSRSNPTVLSVLRDWLRPLPGADIPALQVREAVYEALERLPVNVDDLGSSRIGEILFALSQHPSETARNRDKLVAMIERFSRSIFDKNSDYRTGISRMLERQQELGLVTLGSSRRAGSASATSASGAAPAPIDPSSITDADLGRLLGDDLEAAARGSSIGTIGGKAPERQTRHARLAAPLVFDYVVRPDQGSASASVDGSTLSFAIPKPGKDTVNAAISKRLLQLRRASKSGGVRSGK